MADELVISQETHSSSRIPQDSRDRESVRFTEQDLALVDALQSAPRAPWAGIGRALGMDATTAARRWERLRASGLAWVTAYDSARTAAVAFVEVGSRPGAHEEVRERVCALPWVFSVDETTGDHDLFLSVAASGPSQLGGAVQRVIGGIPGVRSLRMHLGITLYGEGGDWRIRALEPARRAELGASALPSRTAYATRDNPRTSTEDQALLTALGADGRLGYTALGAAAGVSEHVARRRVQKMLREGDVTLRCDFAHPLAGLGTTVIYRASVPHSLLGRTGAELARLGQVRLSVSVTGPHNLLVQVLLHGLPAIDPFEAQLAAAFPALEVKDRTVVLHTPKRMGWLLGADGRAVGRVPLAPPAG
ncbi:Lrp/AsnC family transcriptional regulator [Streptomyces sp. NPDC050418]|uniref:Lrp/AsnC family transcriptional regulator n=1 Tax=Streptomyces sp. NPDC050418 TaxID=3365612 RepID=UPI00379FD2BC